MAVGPLLRPGAQQQRLEPTGTAATTTTRTTASRSRRRRPTRAQQQPAACARQSTASTRLTPSYGRGISLRNGPFWGLTAGGGGGGFGTTPACVAVCSGRRQLATYRCPFPWTLSLRRRRRPSASHRLVPSLSFCLAYPHTHPHTLPFPRVVATEPPHCPCFTAPCRGGGGGGGCGSCPRGPRPHCTGPRGGPRVPRGRAPAAAASQRTGRWARGGRRAP